MIALTMVVDILKYWVKHPCKIIRKVWCQTWYNANTITHLKRVQKSELLVHKHQVGLNGETPPCCIYIYSISALVVVIISNFEIEQQTIPPLVTKSYVCKRMNEQQNEQKQTPSLYLQCTFITMKCKSRVEQVEYEKTHK